MNKILKLMIVFKRFYCFVKIGALSISFQDDDDDDDGNSDDVHADGQKSNEL